MLLLSSCRCSSIYTRTVTAPDMVRLSPKQTAAREAQCCNMFSGLGFGSGTTAMHLSLQLQERLPSSLLHPTSLDLPSVKRMSPKYLPEPTTLATRMLKPVLSTSAESICNARHLVPVNTRPDDRKLRNN